MGDELSVDSVFRVAFGLESPELREEYLRQVSLGDPNLRDRVIALLEASREDPAFLESPATGVGATVDFEPIAERPGTQIGPYKLHQEIGEGGMGIVYMALQKEPVRRKVALKIIKPGMDTREVIARFAAEKQALAIMDHPNIAKVHDAGTTESGRPYFVMELVNGVTLTQYCDENKLTTGQRLELFVPVCHAVQHAHQKGIIHRDIKPSNILVTLHDGVPVPKIIDFGIAKAINQELTSQTLATGYGQMVGTPLYMSPEQAERSGLDIDTRSDIYSLGVLLYELLTGSTPFSRDQFKDAGIDEVRRLIREEEPPRPSTRISTMGMAATTVSEHRRTNPVELSNSLRHELDWIAMKALEKDRTRRYQTANDFARDIQRYLDDEPVEACPPSTVYRLKKFTRRNRPAVLASAAVGLALILGAGVAVGQAYRATKAEKLAEEQLQIANEQQWLAKEQAELARKQKRLAEEAAQRERDLRVEADTARKRAETVADYLVDVFHSPDPARDGRTVTVVEIMDRLQGELDTKFDADPRLKARLLLALGETYHGLGVPEIAVRLLEQSRDIRLQTVGSEHPDFLRSLRAVVSAYPTAGRIQDAVKLAEESRALHLQVYGANHLETLQDAVQYVSIMVLAGRPDEAIRLGEEVLQLARATLGPEHATTLDMTNNLGNAYDPVEHGERVRELREEALRLARKVHGAEHPDTLACMVALGDFYSEVGRNEEAVNLQTEALALSRKVRGPEHPDTLTILNNFAVTQFIAGNILAAGNLWEESLQLKIKLLGPRHPSTAITMINVAGVRILSGNFQQAKEFSDAALDTCREQLGARHRHTVNAMGARARTLLALGDYTAAVTGFEELLQVSREVYGPMHDAPLRSMILLATAYGKVGRHDEAVKLGEEALQIVRQPPHAESRDASERIGTVASVYIDTGHHQEAVALLEEVLPQIRQSLGAEHYKTLVATARLADAYLGVHRMNDAVTLLQQTLPLMQEALGLAHPETLACMLRLGGAYIEQSRYADSEPLLLAAQEGYAKRDAVYPTPYDHSQSREACTQLVQLFKKSNQPDKATAWKEQLDNDERDIPRTGH